MTVAELITQLLRHPDDAEVQTYVGSGGNGLVVRVRPEPDPHSPYPAGRMVPTLILLGGMGSAGVH